MTTKEQERKALEQIKKIVEGLGADSYLATAFEGCFEDAADNIEQDAAYSMKSRLEFAERKANAFSEKCKEHNAKITEYVQKVNTLSDMIKWQEEQNAKLAEELDKVRLALINERKEIKLTTASGEKVHSAVKQFRYINKNGLQFVTVTEPNEWTTSYRLEDLAGLTIE